MTNDRPISEISTPADSRLSVGIVGVGRVGAVLGAALARAGHHVIGGTGVSEASRRRAAYWLPSVPLRPADEVVASADLVVLAVPDDALEDLVEGLAATKAWRSGQFLCHVSGGFGISVLAPATEAGILPMALHPAMTFTDRQEDLDLLSGSCFAVTAPESLRLVAEALVVEMGGEPVWIAEEHRALYHAALATGANHLVTLVTEAADLLRQAGVADPARMLGPLAGAALDNALRLGEAGLTGPVARGDAEMVMRHCEALNRYVPDAVGTYMALARRTADRALSAGILNPSEAVAVLDALSPSVPGDAS